MPAELALGLGRENAARQTGRPQRHARSRLVRTFRRQRWLIAFWHLKELRRLLVIRYRTRFDSSFAVNNETEQHAVGVMHAVCVIFSP